MESRRFADKVTASTLTTALVLTGTNGASSWARALDLGVAQSRSQPHHLATGGALSRRVGDSPEMKRSALALVVVHLLEAEIIAQLPIDLAPVTRAEM